MDTLLDSPLDASARAAPPAWPAAQCGGLGARYTHRRPRPVDQPPLAPCTSLRPRRHVNYYPSPPLKFTDAQLGELKAPTLVVAAEQDLFGPGRATAERAQRAIHDCEAVVLPGARHVPSAAQLREVNSRALAFLAAKGFAPASAADAAAELAAVPSGGLQKDAAPPAAGRPGPAAPAVQMSPVGSRAALKGD